MLYDVFICHASEDKSTFVRPLAEALKAENVAVWYDEFTLKLGDSIRRTIDRGLKQSRFGLVVLSRAFFKKEWTQYELDGLTEREMRGADKVILPIWHEIDHDGVMEYSLSLAGRKAAHSSSGMEAVVSEVLDILRPQGSPLIVARDTLLEWGMTPPVITDEYWLNVVEASNRSPGFGAIIPEDAIWGIWSFPLPYKGTSAEEWGERLAWAAMQSQWVEAAESQSISLASHPNEVCRFINELPGLLQACTSYPKLAAEYVPQITIPGFGGSLEVVFEEQYQESLKSRAKFDKGGAGLTTTGESPLCDDYWALRDPSFGNYDASHVACEYFTGGMFGPSVSPYEHADHLFWLLSTDSNWMPERVRTFLGAGMKKWAVWEWNEFENRCDGDWPTLGAFSDLLYSTAEKGKPFKWSRKAKDDLQCRVEFAIQQLKLCDSADAILNAFETGGYVEALLERRGKQLRRSKKN